MGETHNDTRKGDSLKKIDDMKLASTLTANSGNVSQTAEELLLSRQAIYNRLGDDNFRQTYNAVRLTIMADDLDRLRDCRSDAIETMYDIMNDGDVKAEIRLKAASELLHQCRQEEKLMHDLEVAMVADQKESALNLLGWSIAQNIV